jgi:sarcosine oxidase subunit delta
MKKVSGRRRGHTNGHKMLRIDCPYCGVRDFTEFHYGGDASRQMPDLADADIDLWTEYLMFRDNTITSHAEYWQHRSGCRQWFRVVRNTLTHDIESVTPARDVVWPVRPQE